MKKYSYLSGFILLIVALGRATVLSRWDAAGYWMAGGGGVILLISIAANWSEIREWFSDPRGVFAVNTTISAVLLAGVIVLANVLVVYKPFQMDWTASGRNTLTRETVAIVQKLPSDVQLRQFGREREPRVDQLLTAFGGASSRIKVEFVDAELFPREAADHGVIKNGTVIVKAGEKYRKVEDATEPAIATAILQVTSDVEPKMCFVSGHGEHGLADEGQGGFSKLTAVLKASNFLVESVGLLEGDIPETCAAVVVAGPKQPLQTMELDRLGQYLNGGGGVALLVDPDPGISMAEWVKPWGIVVGVGMIIDASPQGQTVGSGPETPLALQYGDHAITRGFAFATQYDRARPIDVATTDIGKPVPLARTSDRSFEKLDFASQAVTFVPSRDRRGPLTLAAAWSLRLTRDVEKGIVPRHEEARLVVFGDSDFISNSFLSRQGNRDFFLRSLSWLANEEEAKIVRVDDSENRRIDLTEQTKLIMYLVNLVVLPLIPLVAGIVVFIRSKR